MIHQPDEFSSYYYYFRSNTRLKDEVDDLICPVKKEDLIMDVRFFCGMTPDDLRIFEDTSQADFPSESNGAINLATIWCYEENESKWEKIKELEEVFVNLKKDFDESIECFWNDVLDYCAIHNRSNSSCEEKHRTPWIFYERTSKLYVPKMDVTKQITTTIESSWMTSQSIPV